MKTIVVIARQQDWQEAQKTGTYTQSTINSTLKEVGFIHCSFPKQTLDTANRKYKAYNKLVVLLIDDSKVNAPVLYEGALSGRAGTFPHIYGALNIDAVYSYAALKKDFAGNFVEPPELTKVKKSKPLQ